jgi:aspartate kinase
MYSGRKSSVVVTQGFIGGTDEAYSTTLGREGSDFTAGIIANILDAERVTVWKDVPGVMNADPEWMSGTQKLPVISYKEAVEMSFSGAKVIHPKTIKPLHNKGIPLIVRSFLNPSDPGTMISVDESIAQDVPLFIKKEKQVLVSLVPRDFSFVIGDNLGVLFQRFYEKGVKINLVQTSAVSIAVSVDEDIMKLNGLIAVLSEEYKVLVNRDVELITLRYYSDEAIKRVTSGREVLLEQRTRRSIRYVLG